MEGDRVRPRDNDSHVIGKQRAGTGRNGNNNHSSQDQQKTMSQEKKNTSNCLLGVSRIPLC